MLHSFDPDPRFLAHWLRQPLATAPVQPEFLGEQLPAFKLPVLSDPPTAQQALSAFERLLDEFDTRTTLGEYLRCLDAHLGELRPGGSWYESERKAVEQIRLVLVRMRRRFL